MNRPSPQSDTSSSDWDSDEVSGVSLPAKKSLPIRQKKSDVSCRALRIWGVKVVDYFSDKVRFITSASIHMREGRKVWFLVLEMFLLVCF